MTQKNNIWGMVLAGGEGTRVQSFLAQACGGKGIKQFCTIIGSRSMLQHSIARAAQLIPRDQILVSLNSNHRREAIEQLSDLPLKNLVFQPANLDTAPGILLPLAHISMRDPDAVVAVFPSDHFVANEEKFMAQVEAALEELHYFPDALILLGVTPDGVDDGYGWIEPDEKTAGRAAIGVRGFWEKPDPAAARRLKLKGCLWNTFVFVVRAATLWDMVSNAAPQLSHTFWNMRLMVDSIHSRSFVEHCYRCLQPVNFSSTILAHARPRLKVLPVPKVGWSDWGTQERILASLEAIGRLDEFLQRARSARPAEFKKVVRRAEPISRGFAPHSRAADQSPS
ncbi:MAG TPA: sugar phosphate nucleotidyltransferase [Candidatus Binatia bacterium]|nr:sugar phosphate nucleotidyltransferase [Candidatus Binatia bacterium]